MVKSIRREEFNLLMKKSNFRFRPFVGATLSDMKTYVQPELNDDTLHVLVLQISCNGIRNKRLPAEKITDY